MDRLRTEPHRRWSAGFSCLCFAWVGVPMAVRLRNRDFLTSFFLCFLPILVVYYPLLMYGIGGAKDGTIPPVAVWTGNLLLVCWGAWLVRRVIRY
jgi:lipopolysaccharide export system permease protein